jgi:hypothetical protein
MMWKGCGKFAERIYKSVGWVMMRKESRKKTGRKQKVVKKTWIDVEMRLLWYGMTVESKQKEAKENRKEIERKQNGSSTKGKQKEHRQETERKQKGKWKGKGKGGKKKWTRKEVEIKQKLIPQ